ncbi:MAG: hypothetical protein WBO55_16625 [Rhizobiaceae bacterium]
MAVAIVDLGLDLAFERLGEINIAQRIGCIRYNRFRLKRLRLDDLVVDCDEFGRSGRWRPYAVTS